MVGYGTSPWPSSSFAPSDTPTNLSSGNERLTLSFYTEAYRKALQLCGTKSGRDTDKVAATGLTPVPLESGAMTFAEARLTIEGRKLFKAPMQESHFLDAEILERWYGAHGGLHDVYVVEIENVYEG